MKRFVLFSLLALLLGGVVGGSTARAGPPEVRVPRLVGADLDDAMARLAERALQADVHWSAHGAPGRVVAQHPRPNSLVRVGDPIEIVVGLRIPVETIVPRVVGLTEEEAIRGLAPVYEVEILEVPAGPGREDRVVAQDPGPGARHPFRDVIRLSVGREGLETETAIVPAFVGLGLAEAEQATLDLGLVPQPVFGRGGPGSRWNVVGQDPPGSAELPVGSRVRLDVARPRRWTAPMRVPSLYGLDEGAALQVLVSLGLRADVLRQSSLFPAETVLRTAPAHGERVRRGSVVRVLVAAPRGRHGPVARVLVPNLRHRTLPEVRAAVREAGLRLAVRRVVAPERPPEQVIVQRPVAGAPTQLGAVVRVDLPKLAEVPRLLGLPAVAARRAAAELGFAIHFEGDHPGQHRAAARVVDQLPAPGSVAAVGTTVRAVLRARQGGRRVAVPDLKGRSATAARAELAELGLAVRFTGPRLPVQVLLEVVAQDPAPGTRVPRGTTVEATLGLRPRPVAPLVHVPDVTGLSLAEAERRLAARGLTARATFVRGGGPRGVTGQLPVAGSRIPRGEEVRLTVRR